MLRMANNMLLYHAAAGRFPKLNDPMNAMKRPLTLGKAIGIPATAARIAFAWSVVFCAGARLGALPESATVQAVNYSTIVGDNSPGDSAAITHTDQWVAGQPDNPLSVSSIWSATNYTYTTGNTVGMTISPDGNSGSATMTDEWTGGGPTEWFTGTYESLNYYVTGLNPSGATYWSYTFEADVSGQVTLDYDTPINSSYINLPGSLFATTQSVGGIGSETANVTAGSMYTIGIEDIFNNSADFGVSSYGVLGASPYTETGDFSFDISGNPQGVPDDCETFALLGTALAGLAALRRRFVK